MPLDNTAKMSDIISALQTMEGINAKADLASVIGTPATADDTMAILVSLIQQSKNELATKMDDGSSGADSLQTLVGNLVMGKKWAAGEVRITNSVNYSFDIAGLDFLPTDVYYFVISAIGKIRSGVGSANSREKTWIMDADKSASWFSFYDGASYKSWQSLPTFQNTKIANLPIDKPAVGEYYNIRWVAFGD